MMTAMEIATRLKMLPKDKWQEILKEWSDEIVDACTDNYSDWKSSSPEVIIEVIQKVKEEI